MSSIIAMLKKDAAFFLLEEPKKVFKDIKKTITKAHILNNIDFSKDFIMYAYGVEKSVATILVQKDEQKKEHPIVFHGQTLHQH